jgi:hypothetical protein
MTRTAVLFLALTLCAACGGKAESDAQPAGGGGSGGTHDGGLGGSGNVAGDAATDVVVPDVSVPTGQNILFEVEYENFAWAPNLNGVFITADGSVMKYDFFASDAGATPPSVVYPATEDEIRARYGPSPTKIGSIPTSELAAHFALVPGAASGVLLRQYACADAGESTTMAYLFDTATARYTPVILGVDGDEAALNLAPEAASLVAWLSQYAPLGGSCAFTGQECTGATCGTPAPSCPSGQLPSVVNGCWSDCVSADRCFSVDDCAKCPGGDLCATAVDGSLHCVLSNCQSADGCSCPFTPPCAGGSAFCTSNEPFRLTCGK